MPKALVVIRRPTALHLKACLPLVVGVEGGDVVAGKPGVRLRRLDPFDEKKTEADAAIVVASGAVWLSRGAAYAHPMRVVFLLGSGASLHAGMPSVGEITGRVLSGERVLEGGAGFRVVDQLPANHAIWRRKVDAAVAFAAELKQLCDDYWASQDKGRQTNYEDIAYVARQVDDGLMSEYENPALLPLNKKLGEEVGREPRDLMELAAMTADYIDDVVCGMLGGPIGPVDHLAAIADACSDGWVEDLTVATLNHDLVLERMFSETNTHYSDGFEREFGTLRIWSDTFDSTRKLLKLHGSINWWRYRFALDGHSGQLTAKSTNRDPEHPRGPVGEDLGYPLTGRPLVLTGTFNKILAYPTGIYADQHFRFHEALNAAEALIVIGYGFRDKAINARIVAWAERPGARQMLVVHRDPAGFAVSARGAIRNLWTSWHERGVLAFVPEHLSPATTWESIAAKLR